MFLGEYPHHTLEIRNAVSQVVVALATSKHFGTFAIEGSYGLYHLWECRSSKGRPVGVAGDAVNEYNRSSDRADGLTVTAVDLEHSVRDT